MREEGVAEPAITKKAFSIVFVSKKNGSLRFCVEKRCLNAVTDWYRYRLIPTDEHIDSLGEAKMFLAPDASSGYWQIKTNDTVVYEMAFVTHYGITKYFNRHLGYKMQQRRSSVQLTLYWPL